MPTTEPPPVSRTSRYRCPEHPDEPVTRTGAGCWTCAHPLELMRQDRYQPRE